MQTSSAINRRAHLFESPLATFKHQAGFVGELLALLLEQLSDRNILTAELLNKQQKSDETNDGSEIEGKKSWKVLNFYRKLIQEVRRSKLVDLGVM